MISVQTSTTVARPVIAERSTIQLAPKIAPSPTVEVSIARPLRPAVEDPVGEARKQLDKAAGADRRHDKEQQHRPNPGVPVGVGERVDCTGRRSCLRGKDATRPLSYGTS